MVRFVNNQFFLFARRATAVAVVKVDEILTEMDGMEKNSFQIFIC